MFNTLVVILMTFSVPFVLLGTVMDTLLVPVTRQRAFEIVDGSDVLNIFKAVVPKVANIERVVLQQARILQAINTRAIADVNADVNADADADADADIFSHSNIFLIFILLTPQSPIPG